MTTYSTQNPLGSADPRDLYDNAENLDTAMNANQDEWTDRLGLKRATFRAAERAADQAVNVDIPAIVDNVDSQAQQYFENAESDREDEFAVSQQDKQQRFNLLLANSGYEYLADYAAGIEITEYNQVLRDTAGELWRAAATTTLPYTTDGAGLPESGAFVAVGDADIRNDLAAGVGAGKGGLLVAGAVIYVDTITDLQALDTSGLVEGQRVDLSDGTSYRWISTKSSWEVIGRHRLINRGSLDGSSQVDWANFPDAPRRTHVIHHYNDREMCVYDNVGEDNVFFLLRNASNPTRRDDKPEDFIGTGDFLRFQNRYPHGGDFQTFGVFELNYDGSMRWPNQGNFNGSVDLINAQVTHNSEYSFRLDTKTSNDKLLEITESDLNPAFQFKAIGGTLARIDSGAGMTSGMYLNVESGSFNIVAKNGPVNLEAQSGKDYYARTNTGWGWLLKFLDGSSRPTNAPGGWRTAPGERGDFWASIDGAYVYVCYAPDSWCRIPAETS